MPNYAVCTRCDFLRVLGERARGVRLPEECPKCGSELVYRYKEERFEPTYVGRVSRWLHQSRL